MYSQETGEFSSLKMGKVQIPITCVTFGTSGFTVMNDTCPGGGCVCNCDASYTFYKQTQRIRMNENRTKRVLIKEIIDSVGICRIGQQEQGVTPK